MIYAVIDTNVFVSAYITKNRQAATVKVVSCILNNDIVPLYNDEILTEYSEVLRRPKFKLKDEEVTSLINYIKKDGINSARTPYDKNMPDEKDRVFYEVSLSNKDSFLVTGNLKHFPHTIKVVTPAEMIAIIDADE